MNSTVMGEGADLVLLHGWGFNSSIWHEFATQLAQQYRVTLIDLPGCGRSGFPPEKYDLAMLKKSILQVAPAKATYIGWSLGGMLAMAITAEHPERVERLMTICSAPRFIATQNWPGVALEMLNDFSAKLIANYQATLTRFLLLQMLNVPERQKITKILKEKLLQEGAPSIEALAGGLTVLRDTDLRSQLQQITCPQLYIFGRLDVLVPALVQQQIQLLAPAAQTVLMERAAHVPFLSHLHETLAHVWDFLNNA